MQKSILSLLLLTAFSANAANSTYFLVTPVLTADASVAGGSGPGSSGGAGNAGPAAKVDRIEAPSFVDFGLLTTGLSRTQEITITNNGDNATALNYQAPSTVAVTDSCNSVIAAGASCLLSLSWENSAGLPLDESLTIGGTHSSAVVTLTGQSQTAAKLTGGGAQDFGSVTVGASMSKTWTLSNTGEATASLSAGSLPSGVVRSGSCGDTLAGNTNCTLTLTWTPTAAGALNTAYVVGSQALSLTGTAVAGATGVMSVQRTNYCEGCDYGYTWSIVYDTYGYLGAGAGALGAPTSIPNIGNIVQLTWAQLDYDDDYGTTRKSYRLYANFSGMPSTNKAPIKVTINGAQYTLSVYSWSTQYGIYDYEVYISAEQFNAMPKSGTASWAVSY